MTYQDFAEHSAVVPVTLTPERRGAQRSGRASVRSYLCLFDSLALIHFLARFRVFPDWVFGVTADPFEAHCWVQTGGVVLNDTVERVSAFTPIMSI